MTRRRTGTVVAAVGVVGAVAAITLWATAEPDTLRRNGRAPQLERLIEAHGTPVLLARYSTTLKYRLPGEGQNIAVASDLLAGTVLEPGETFAQNERLGPYTAENGYVAGPMYVGDRIVESVGGGVCQIATTLFNAAVLADLAIGYRRPHSMAVPYAPFGQDATVAYGIVDFILRNSSPDPVLIWSEVVGDYDWFEVSLYSRHRAPDVQWTHETWNRVPYSTEVVVDPSAAPGTERVVQPGQDGITVRSFVTVEYADGSSRRRDFGVHQYRPTPEIILRGPGGPVPGSHPNTLDQAAGLERVFSVVTGKPLDSKARNLVDQLREVHC